MELDGVAGVTQPASLVLQMKQIRDDIRDFRSSSGVDKVIVLWTANTERFCDVVPGVNDSAKNLLAAIQVIAEANTYEHKFNINSEKGKHFAIMRHQMADL